MTKLIRAEVYKLFRSLYLWGIWLAYLVFSATLAGDHIRDYTYLRSAIYPISFLLFLIVGLAAVCIGNEFNIRSIQAYVSSGHSRAGVFFAKTFIYSISALMINELTLLIISIVGWIVRGEAIDAGLMIRLAPSLLAMNLVPLFVAFLTKSSGKAMGFGCLAVALQTASVNTHGITEKAIYLPYGHTFTAFSEGELSHYPVIIAIDIVWILVFLTGSYLAFRRSDLK
ncbi:MAG: ABC transporter permease [Clostridiales bacterium]|nr:ABC transporter permease [Clostridiales bacterium]